MDIYGLALIHDMALLRLYSLCIIANYLEINNSEAEVFSKICRID